MTQRHRAAAAARADQRGAAILSDLRAEKKRRIQLAYDYNDHGRRMASCNTLYMGSMATCILVGKLGGKWPDDDVRSALKGATDAQLDDGLAYCQHYLKYAERKA